MIAEFSQDASRTSMELPSMTTGERKSAKKLLEEYPGLRCESFGLGKERRLHLFKSQPQQAGNVKVFGVEPSQLRVKNTFIHFDSPPIEERATQSMPLGVFRECLFAEASQKASGYSTPSTGYETASESDAGSSVDESPAANYLPLSAGMLVVI